METPRWTSGMRRRAATAAAGGGALPPVSCAFASRPSSSRVATTLAACAHSLARKGSVACRAQRRRRSAFRVQTRPHQQHGYGRTRLILPKHALRRSVACGVSSTRRRRTSSSGTISTSRRCGRLPSIGSSSVASSRRHTSRSICGDGAGRVSSRSLSLLHAAPRALRTLRPYLDGSNTAFKRVHTSSTYGASSSSRLLRSPSAAAAMMTARPSASA